MPRYIDADKLIEEANQDGAYGYVSAQEIDEQPTADVVEVVRCKDCRFFKSSVCPLANIEEPQPNDYCSYGERAEK